MKPKLKLEVTIVPHWEQESPKDHFEFDGDIEFVNDQIIAGNIWGWCWIEVIVSAPQLEMAESETLGCCSYKNEADFITDGYYDDLKKEATNSLLRRIKELKYRIDSYDIPKPSKD